MEAAACLPLRHAIALLQMRVARAGGQVTTSLHAAPVFAGKCAHTVGVMENFRRVLEELSLTNSEDPPHNRLIGYYTGRKSLPVVLIARLMSRAASRDLRILPKSDRPFCPDIL